MIFWGAVSVTSRRITGVDRGCASGGHERVDHLTVPLLTPPVGILLEGTGGGPLVIPGDGPWTVSICLWPCDY